MTSAPSPREEAQRVVGPDLFARVLEPSPPAVESGPWFADDPVRVPGDGRPMVSPVTGADLTWDQWLDGHPEHATWAAARWLGARRRLDSPPPSLATTRLALHRLAVYVLSPARRRRNGKIALRYTRGGFGTPFFGRDEQVRIEDGELVLERGGSSERHPVTTLGADADAVLGSPPDVEWAADFDVPEPGPVDAPLPVDPAAAAWLGDWYGFAWSVLEELRAGAASEDATRVQLWPEHFDAAFECLPEAGGRRAGYGASPGDAAHDRPYLYVTPWSFDRVPHSPLWDADTFAGALLSWDALAGADDQRRTALDFFRERLALLADRPLVG
jgi:hypothetical protein